MSQQKSIESIKRKKKPFRLYLNIYKNEEIDQVKINKKIDKMPGYLSIKALNKYFC